jgi:hypothetical protein
MPMAVAAPVLVLMPTSWSASPRVRVICSPGRASEPTARIQSTSGLRSTLVARSTSTSIMSAGFTVESGTTRAATASTRPRRTGVSPRRRSRLVCLMRSRSG